TRVRPLSWYAVTLVQEQNGSKKKRDSMRIGFDNDKSAAAPAALALAIAAAVAAMIAQTKLRRRHDSL
ncbi:hypothetical protein, partial [Eggerthella lenta]|uniref:hypothetical protein n=1 Tax=Eggerthella lenta TaxID=84112 RepID=UPI00210D2B64